MFDFNCLINPFECGSQSNCSTTFLEEMWFYISIWVFTVNIICCLICVLCCCCCCSTLYCCFRKSKHLPKTKCLYSNGSLFRKNKIQKPILNQNSQIEESNKYDTICSQFTRYSTETSFVSNHLTAKECELTPSNPGINKNNNDSQATQSFAYDYITNNPTPKFTEFNTDVPVGVPQTC